MLNYQISMKFSNTHSKKRIEKAYQTLGENIANKIIGFGLFLLGAKREDIAQYIKMPFGTFLSFLTRVHQNGLLAFEDRRKVSFLQPVKTETPPKVTLSMKDQNVCIQLGVENLSINIPRTNLLQCKVVLLTLFNSGLLSIKEISQVLGISSRHTRTLNTRMHDEDVYSIIDNRRGQSQDYRFTPEVKAELIQQIAANAICKKPTSSSVISEHLKQRCNLDLPDRSIRLHVKRMGLSEIVKSLPALVETLKKTPRNASEQSE